MNYLSKLIGIVCLILLFTAGCVWAGEIQIAAAAGDLNKVRALLEADSTLLESKRYRKEIDFLKPFRPIDIAILNVNGHYEVAYEPYFYLLDQLSPKAIYLMGGEGSPSEYPKCADVLRTCNIPVKHPETRIAGDRFHYVGK
jgi:hypothetical protein